MTVQFQNYDYSYDRNGKPIFAPSDLGERIGLDIKRQVEAVYVFDDFVYHLKKNGGHVAALHAHRLHQFFARVDIKNFFYGIAKSRVQRSLADLGILRARHYAKWSCVKSPFDEPRYALPYGFIQSPILATLVLMKSAVGSFLQGVAAAGHIAVSVYMDDISLSSNDETALCEAFEQLKNKLQEANFEISAGKIREPSMAMDVFNCDLSHGKAEVRSERIGLFYAEMRSPESINGFEDYCARVQEGNFP